MLGAELDAWQAVGRRATFWWRDDDATRPGIKLSRLLDLAGTIPLTLAVIPARARPELDNTLAAHREAGGRLSVVQHGFDHRNHAPMTEKKAEYGPHRPLATMIAELADGCRILESLFGERFRPILTPPWNRIAPALVPRLGEAGLAGLSVFGDRFLDSGPNVVNTHIDIIDWRGNRGFAGDEAVLGAAVGSLRLRRKEVIESGPPTGLLTHHVAHDEASWQFLERFVAVVADHPAGLWIDGTTIA
ncbi:MAG: polysaccharide deacetylase family protein [Rhodospirillales bacterium]|nr:MAG: polysaccharide deacetylase family protein [Rhodospirillales bacterium]